MTEPTQQTAEDLAQAEAAKARRRARSQACISILTENWPLLFNSDYRPMKLGVFRDILADISARNLPYAIPQIQHAMYLWVARVSYLRSVRDGEERFDLNGQPAGGIDDKHREHAITQLKATYKRWGKKRSTAKEACQEVVAEEVTG